MREHSIAKLQSPSDAITTCRDGAEASRRASHGGMCPKQPKSVTGARHPRRSARSQRCRWTAEFAAWEPPRRIVFDGGEGVDGLATEWTIEVREGGTCIVRLVNSGFDGSEEWDAQYDGMSEGWKLIMLNLKLHMEHFRGRTATASLPTTMWSGTRDEVWGAPTEALGIPQAPAVSERIEVTAPDAPALAVTVADAAERRVALLLDRPLPGTTFVAAERHGAAVAASIWCSLYRGDAVMVVERDEPQR